MLTRTDVAHNTAQNSSDYYPLSIRQNLRRLPVDGREKPAVECSRLLFRQQMTAFKLRKSQQNRCVQLLSRTGTAADCTQFSSTQTESAHK